MRKFVAPEFVFGEGARHLAAQYAKNFGASKVLLVTDPGVLASGWAREAAAGLAAAEIPYSIFSAVTPNPKAEEVMAGAAEFERNGCDMLVAVGGGSPIDCAKGIGIVSSNNRNILEFEGVDQVPIPGPPLICIPTTAGSAADVSQFAIITDRNRRVKIAIVSKSLVPDVSLIDPATATTMPRELTAHTGMDVLAHAFESYVSNASSPVTDLLALEAARLIATSLPPALEHPRDVALRSPTMLGCLYAGLAFSNAGLGLVHAMAHALGGYLDTPHGESNSMLISRVIEFNFQAAPDRYADLGRAFGADGNSADMKKALLETLDGFRKTLHVDEPLSAYGVKKSDIPELAAKAMKDACVVTNPRRPTQEEIEEIYEQAL